MKRKYIDSSKEYTGLVPLTVVAIAGPIGQSARYHECEHCDGERGSMVRLDPLRGYVCPDCDSALDEMFEEVVP